MDTNEYGIVWIKTNIKKNESAYLFVFKECCTLKI